MTSKATSAPSTTAIKSAARSLRVRSQRPARLVSRGSASPCTVIGSTVPGRHGEPGPAAARERAHGGPRGALVLEEAVDGGACPADVGTEGAEPAQLARDRRGGKVVRRQGREV